MEQVIIKQYKSSVSDIDEKGIITVGANAFGNEDADGDISVQGSYTKTIKENFNRVKWFLNHDKTQLLGVPIEATETQKHLQVRGAINLNKQIGRDTYEDYKMYASQNKSLEHSVGVQAMKRDSNDARKVTEWKWWEYSTLTSWGANEQTPLIGLKSLGTIADQIDFLELSLRKANYSDVKGKQIEQQIINLKALVNDEPLLNTQEGHKPQFDINKAIKKIKILN